MEPAHLCLFCGLYFGVSYAGILFSVMPASSNTNISDIILPSPSVTFCAFLCVGHAECNCAVQVDEATCKLSTQLAISTGKYDPDDDSIVSRFHLYFSVVRITILINTTL